jgi:hypothetical protein
MITSQLIKAAVVTSRVLEANIAIFGAWGIDSYLALSDRPAM